MAENLLSLQDIVYKLDDPWYSLADVVAAFRPEEIADADLRILWRHAKLAYNEAADATQDIENFLAKKGL